MSKLEELPVLEPRNKCARYMWENEVEKPILLTKEDFDAHAKAGDFEVGPHRDNFGDSYGEPYNPNRQAFGKLKDGRFVYCELSKDLKERAGEHLGKNKSGGRK